MKSEYSESDLRMIEISRSKGLVKELLHRVKSSCQHTRYKVVPVSGVHRMDCILQSSILVNQVRTEVQSSAHEDDALQSENMP